MYSQCPECQTRFRVTAVALRAAHGTVRCGRCGSAFDALQRLTDALPDDTEAAASVRTLEPALGTLDAPPPIRAGSDDDDDAVIVPDMGGDADGAGTDFHFSADDIERVFIDARDWQQRYPSSGAGDGAPVVFVHEPEAIEDITLEGERVVIEGLPDLDDDLREILREGDASDDAAPLPEQVAPPPDTDSADQSEALREGGVADTGRGGDVPGLGADPRQAVTARAPEPASSELPPIVPFRLRQREFPVDAEPDGGLEGDASTSGRGGVLWAVGVLLLIVVLVAQVVHHFRQELARDASIGPLVRSAYARIGRPLAPNWDLAAFELRQWGPNESAPPAPGKLEVRASLRNDAGFAQPLPLLRLELEDRFGDTVARRDFEPGEYLNDPAQAPRMLAPGATTEASLTVVDEGTDAVGYRLDVCMRDDAAVTHCAEPVSQDRPGTSR